MDLIDLIYCLRISTVWNDLGCFHAFGRSSICFIKTVISSGFIQFSGSGKPLPVTFLVMISGTFPSYENYWSTYYLNIEYLTTLK